MSDSRYGIVDKLTQQKVALLKERSELDSSIDDFDVKLLEIQMEYQDRKESLEKEMGFIKEKFYAKKNQVEAKKKSLTDNKEKREKAIDEQIKSIEEALEKLLEISAMHQKSQSQTQQ